MLQETTSLKSDFPLVFQFCVVILHVLLLFHKISVFKLAEHCQYCAPVSVGSVGLFLNAVQVLSVQFKQEQALLLHLTAATFPSQS